MYLFPCAHVIPRTNAQASPIDSGLSRAFVSSKTRSYVSTQSAILATQSDTTWEFWPVLVYLIVVDGTSLVPEQLSNSSWRCIQPTFTWRLNHRL